MLTKEQIANANSRESRLAAIRASLKNTGLFRQTSDCLEKKLRRTTIFTNDESENSIRDISSKGSCG